jgi:drug/metabolite transporter (DMT)-like permease
VSGVREADDVPARRLVGIGCVLLSSFLIAVTPNAAKIAYQEGANPLAVITFRCVLGAAGLALYLSLMKRWPQESWKTFQKSSLAGLAQAFTALGFLGAVAFIDVSLAALIFYFHIFLVAVVGHFRGDVRLNRKLLSYIAAAVLGLALVLGVTLKSLNVMGLGLSLLGMAAVTVMIFTVGRTSREVGPIAANFHMTLWASIFFVLVVVIAPMTDSIDGMVLPTSAKGWVGIIGNSVTTTLGFVLFFTGAGIIGMTRATVLSVMEPVLAIFLAILLVQEWLTPVQWAGVILIVGSLYLFEKAGQEASDALQKQEGCSGVG